MHSLTRRLTLSIFGLWIVLGFVTGAQAQGGIIVTQTQVDYLFGQHISFAATIESPQPIHQVQILFRAQSDDNTEVHDADLIASSQVSFQYDLTEGGAILPFTTITYWYFVTLENGDTYESPKYSFDYHDNRFEWQTLEGAQFRVHWVEGDLAFAQAILDTAEYSIQNTAQFIQVAPLRDIDIYVYASAADLRAALRLVGQPWIAGHTDPELSIVLVSLAPGPEQSLEIERQIPHEVAHILLYRTVGGDYANLPLWLTEGIASLAELYPNPDYHQALLTANQNNTLIPLTILCPSFPVDAGSVQLAYAQSADFVRYLHQQYGSAGLQDLIEQYAAGESCEFGTLALTGSALTQLDYDWRQATFAESAIISDYNDLFPWLGILLVMLAGPISLLLLNLRKKVTP